MGDLIGFKGFENASAPFSPTEYQVEWKSDRHYLDFDFGNTYNATCQYPRFWDESGFPVTRSTDPNVAQLRGCYDSEFDQVSNEDTTRYHKVNRLIVWRRRGFCRRSNLAPPALHFLLCSRSPQRMGPVRSPKDRALFMPSNHHARYRWVPD
jgi:hypothetical protein